MEANQSTSLISESNIQFASIESGVPITSSKAGIGTGQVFARENVVTSALRQSAHPTVLAFHFIFRSAAIVVYLFLGWFVIIRGGGGSIFVFVLTTILLAVDFWQVKNVSGRLLVGLRWWQEQTDQGTTQTILQYIKERNGSLNREMETPR